jgi:hypothetical protein
MGGRMTYAVNDETFASSFGRKVFAKGNAIANHADILWHFFDVIFEWRERQTDRESDNFVARSCGAFTDQIERDMMQRLPRW